MFKKDTVQKIKNALVIVVIGSVFSIIPFYFDTRAMTHENGLINVRQEEELRDHDSKIQQSIINDAIEKTKTEQIKETLNRIEVKLDKLIEKELESID